MEQTQLPEQLSGRIRAQWPTCDRGMLLNISSLQIESQSQI